MMANSPEHLHADLQSKNVRCWFAPEDLKIGDKFRTRIEESIRVYDKLMVRPVRELDSKSLGGGRG